jgi:uncharacterized protein YabN with tetrapyrrole methylase and pyrophosphatase domain
VQFVRPAERPGPRQARFWLGGRKASPAIARSILLIYIEQDVYHRRTIRASGSDHGAVAGSGGCPWDREQTFDTIKPYTLEETYEVLEAIDNRDWPELTGELGDLLLQVLFYSRDGARGGHFSVDDVLDRLANKLVDRHPHVFGDVKADTPAEVLRNWEALKAEEKKKRLAAWRRSR